MRQGNTSLYILIGVAALAVIGFLVMQNRDSEVDDSTTIPAEEATETQNAEAVDGPIQEENQEDTTPARQSVIVGGVMMDSDLNIIENASKSSDHTTFVAAVEAAGLTDSLSGDGPFTVFAPTNAAFDKMPPGTLEELVLPENKTQLTEILTYHVVPEELTSGEITEGLQVETVNGKVLTFNKKDDQWWINDSAMITISDVVTSNGIIHVIDGVLTPE